MPGAITGASIDTRTIAPGETFFAILGEARDGHDFVAGALEKGAGLAVIDEAGRLVGELEPREIMEEMGRVEELVDGFEREKFL
jgi:UDP-N-acetylmuramoyl-tripeptide--D-alanyl-D-alanine ligase